MAYFGLYALQHRGQESTGIASYDGKHIRLHAGMGLVPDVYDEATLGQELQGNRAIGHVRYSTSGVSVRKNAQPLVVRVCGIEIALAHNGNLTNASELRGELESEGAIFQTSSDSEIFVHLIARSLAKKKDLEEAILSACDRVRGAYSLIILSEGRIIALRDAHGFHPLAMGKVDDAYVFASETCAFDLLEAEYLREVLPGEMVVVDGDKVVSRPLNNAGKVPVRQCIFELVYFARPDSIVFGEDVYQCRKHMGYEMAKEAPTDAELVMPFPDSGVYAAIGFAHAAGVPYEQAYIRNHYVGRTFIQPSQTMRNFGVRVKLNPVRSMIKNRRICIVDDSIVRGTTMVQLVRMLRQAGAKEIHIRINCPEDVWPCFYGVDTGEQSQLISATKSVEEVCEFIGADTLAFLSVDALLECVPKGGYCTACFTGEYPVAIPESFGRDKFIEGYTPRNLSKLEPITGRCVVDKAEDRSWEEAHGE